MKKFFTVIVLCWNMLFGQPDGVTPLGPNGGIITLLEGSLNDDVVFAVVRDAGLYRSVDGGESWQKISLPAGTKYNSIDVLDFAFHPSNADSILMATSLGLYGSGDRGATWNQVAGFPIPRYSVEYVPANPSIVFGSDENGVLRSTDGGKFWMPMKDGQFFGNRTVRRIAIHPSDGSNIRLVATTGFDDTTGIFLSTNGGVNWSPFNKSLPAGNARRIYAVEMDSTGLGTNNFRVIVGTAQGMYGAQTDQRESSFVAIQNSNIPINGVITCGVLVYDKFDTTVAGGEHDFAFYYASNGSEYDGIPQSYTKSNGIFKISSVKGSILTLSPLSPPPVIRVFNGLSDITSIHVPTHSNKLKVYAGTTNGVYVSSDGGSTWQRKNNGIDNTIIRNTEMVSVPPSTSILFSSVYGGGVIRSSDGGATWSSANNGIGNPYVTTVQVDHHLKIVYAGSVNGLYQSFDGGTTWTSKFTIDSTNVINASRFSTKENDMTIRISPVNSNFILLYTPSCGMRLSSDGGSTWKYLVSPNAVDTTHVPENIAFDPVDVNTIYYTGLSIFKSIDLGITWTDISSNIPKTAMLPDGSGSIGLQTISPTINPVNANEMFVSTVYDIAQGSAYRLFKTTNGGQSWDPLSIQIPAYDVEYDRFDPARLVASGPFGLARTTDGGTTWNALTDSASTLRYYLLSSHPDDPNILFAGSEQGSHRIQLGDYSHLTVDTVVYDFGSILLTGQVTRNISFQNTAGLRSVSVKFLSLSSSAAFTYGGPAEITVPAGGSQSVPVQFKPGLAGKYSAVLKFISTDLLLDTVRILLNGTALSRNMIENFSYDFGSVTVGKDSVLTIDVDNSFGVQPIGISFLGNTDTISFQYLGQKAVTIDTGTVGTFAFRFAPKTRGEKSGYALFGTTDARFPTVKFKLQGIGISKTYLTRRILIDGDVGFAPHDGSSLGEYFKILRQSLVRAEMNVDTAKIANYSTYDAAVYIQPNGAPPAGDIDSLQRFVVNGGTLILMGDAGTGSQLPFNTFLTDSTWVRKYGVKPGIRFNANSLIDTSSQGSLGGWVIAARPNANSLYNYKIDSVMLYGSGSLTIDSAAGNLQPLLFVKSNSLFSEESHDTIQSFQKINSAVVAAIQSIGKGKIIAIADYDIWWNGAADDSLHTSGILAGNNLRFALNVFGLVDNLLARLPEPTPQEEYRLISIPYAFSDSSVTALFKDLGAPNELVWRMFGRWNETKNVYEEFPKDFKVIRRGEGYWLITKQPMTIDFGTTSVQGNEDDFSMTLLPGYNLIGNPFPYAVSWSNSVLEDSVERIIWKFDKVFDSTSTVMEPFRGYFVKNRATTPRKITINSEQVTSPSASLGKTGTITDHFTANEWKIRMSASASKSRDGQTFIGMLKNSKDGFDDNDFSKPPPAPGDYVSLVIHHGNDALAADYRAISATGSVWDLALSSSRPNTPVTLSFDPFGNIPPNFSIYIIDFTDERIYDVTQSHSLSLALRKNEYSRTLRAVVGSKDFLGKNSSGIPLVPLHYAMEQNFPNPFNPVTTIRYSIAHSADVKIAVFNVLGQKMKTIVDSFQPIGEYAVQWDGTDNAGMKTASGVYYYRIQANEFTEVKKMTLIK